MGNQFLKGLQRPAIMPEGSSLPDYSEANDGDALIIEDGEPTWGAVDALPEIEEADEGKVLAVDQGEAVWADAPSGLPEITNSDEGKVLTVVGEAERTEIIPEQSLTTTGAMIAEATIPNHADNPPESMTVEIDGVAYTNVQFDSSSESYTISNGSTTVGQIAVDGDDWVFIKTPAGTYTLSAYIESPKEYSAQWAELSGGLIVTLTMDTETTVIADASYNDIVTAIESGVAVMVIVDNSMWGGSGTSIFYPVLYGAGDNVYGVQIAGAFSGAFGVISLTASTADAPLTGSLE